MEKNQTLDLSQDYEIFEPPKWEIKELIIGVKEWKLVKDLNQFKNLEILYLFLTYKIEDVEFMENVYVDFALQKNLKKIIFTDNICSYYSPTYNVDVKRYNFSGLINLEELEIFNPSKDLDLKECNKLKYLTIYDNNSVLTYINQPNIEVLSLKDSCSNLKLNNLINLTELSFDNVCIGLIDLKNQTKLTKLRYIGYQFVNSLININENLKELNIEGESRGDDKDDEIISTKELRNLVNLERLFLSWISINIIDLSQMNKLEYVEIEYIENLNIIIHPKVFPREFYIEKWCTIFFNLVYSRRRIVGLNEINSKDICRKCNKQVLKHKKINIRSEVYNSSRNLYKIYESCC